MGIPILKAVRDTRYVNACSKSAVKSHQQCSTMVHEKSLIAHPDTRPQAYMPRCLTEKHYLSSLHQEVLKVRKTEDRELTGPLEHLAQLHSAQHWQVQASILSGSSSARTMAVQGQGELESSIHGIPGAGTNSPEMGLREAAQDR